jgi:hypothetical protein
MVEPTGFLASSGSVYKLLKMRLNFTIDSSTPPSLRISEQGGGLRNTRCTPIDDNADLEYASRHRMLISDLVEY